jgi:hypothetical protein
VLCAFILSIVLLKVIMLFAIMQDDNKLCICKLSVFILMKSTIIQFAIFLSALIFVSSLQPCITKKSVMVMRVMAPLKAFIDESSKNIIF